MPLTQCEACHHAPLECSIDSDEPEQPYLLCEQCAHRLLTFSLRPLEWFRLAARHGPSQFYLHDDFYFFHGVAQVPREEVLFPELFPAPTLEEAAEDLETLIDYAMTQHHLAFEEKTLALLRKQNTSALLASLQERNAHPHAVEREAQAYEICANVLEREAQAWIRSRWDVFRPGAFFSLAAASAACLPFQEGFHRVIHELNAMTQKEVRHFCSVLAHFRTAKTLDWLEMHVSTPVTATWGRLAAVSQLSWARVTKWLEQGRPLSLVALDALYACGHYDTPLLRKLTPKLLEPDTRARMTERLEWYAADDPAPRVQQRVAAITSQWDAILL